MFLKRNDKNNEEQFRKNSTIAIKKWVKEKLLLNDDITIMVTEINCWEINCPDKETVIAVFQEGNNKTYKIKKPLLYVREWDIDVLLKN